MPILSMYFTAGDVRRLVVDKDFKTKVLDIASSLGVEIVYLETYRGGTGLLRKSELLKALKYCELRSLYPQLPSHYIYTVCQDVSALVKSFFKSRKKKSFPEVKKVSILLDDILWKMDGLTSIRVSTHVGRVRVEFEPHKQYWMCVNRGWRLASEVRVKLD